MIAARKTKSGTLIACALAFAGILGSTAGPSRAQTPDGLGCSPGSVITIHIWRYGAWFIGPTCLESSNGVVDTFEFIATGGIGGVYLIGTARAYTAAVNMAQETNGVAPIIDYQINDQGGSWNGVDDPSDPSRLINPGNPSNPYDVGGDDGDLYALWDPAAGRRTHSGGITRDYLPSPGMPHAPASVHMLWG